MPSDGRPQGAVAGSGPRGCGGRVVRGTVAGGGGVRRAPEEPGSGRRGDAAGLGPRRSRARLNARRQGPRQLVEHGLLGIGHPGSADSEEAPLLDRAGYALSPTHGALRMRCQSSALNAFFEVMLALQAGAPASLEGGRLELGPIGRAPSSAKSAPTWPSSSRVGAAATARDTSDASIFASSSHSNRPLVSFCHRGHSAPQPLGDWDKSLIAGSAALRTATPTRFASARNRPLVVRRVWSLGNIRTGQRRAGWPGACDGR